MRTPVKEKRRRNNLVFYFSLVVSSRFRYFRYPFVSSSIMQAWMMQMYYRFNTYRAGLSKCSLMIDLEQNSAFSYCEKGSKVDGKPSLVFIHGLSSNKETWLPIIKNIPTGYHCLTLDLPAHGETTGLNESSYTVDKFLERLKEFFDRKGLTEPMCLIGASLGGAIVLMFALKYPQYVQMICLLAPPANAQSETALVEQLRSGVYRALLPETTDELNEMIKTLTVKQIRTPKVFLNGFLDLRLRLIDEHRKVLSSLITNDYPHLESYYENLKNLQCPALFLWGREDRVFTHQGADYFCQLIPQAEKKVFDHCGHFLAIDQPEETALTIIDFFDRYSNNKI